MERIKLRLTVDLEYAMENRDKKEVGYLMENLSWVLENAYSNGVFTRDTEATLVDYEHNIEEIQK